MRGMLGAAVALTRSLLWRSHHPPIHINQPHNIADAMYFRVLKDYIKCSELTPQTKALAVCTVEHSALTDPDIFSMNELSVLTYDT